jgi:hypothetical protein
MTMLVPAQSFWFFRLLALGATYQEAFDLARTRCERLFGMATVGVRVAIDKDKLAVSR